MPYETLMIYQSEKKLTKIVFVITGLYLGGAEMMLLKLLSRIDRDQFLPMVISLMHRGPLDERVEALGIKVSRLNVKRGKLSLSALIKLIKILRDERPDLIQGWMYHGFIAAQIAALFLQKKVPVLWNVRGTHTDLSKERFLTMVIIKFSGLISYLPKRIINNSLTSALSHEKVVGYPPAKRIIIPNGFDLNAFCPSSHSRASFRKEIGLCEDDFVIGLIARYAPMKGHSVFLEAAGRVINSYPTVKFVLVGDGVDERNHEIIKQINSLNLKDHVKLLGRRDDVASVMAGLDILTSSSPFGEGFSNVIGEAMCCAVPCVVTDVGDSAWIVGDTGLVVPPQDPDTLAKSWLEYLGMDHYKKYEMGIKARQRIVENFSLEAVVHRYEMLYQEMVSS